MNKTFLKEQMMRLEANYGTDKFKITKQMFDLWYEMFSNCEEEGVKASIDEYIRDNEFPPTIASIMKIYKAKESLKKESHEYMLNTYNWVAKWYGEIPGEETYTLFAKHISNRPLNEVKSATDELSERLIRYYNDNSDNPDRKTLKEVLMM